MSRLVVALGGNALGATPAEQLRRVDSAAASVVALVTAGHQAVVCHGNGPQVGMISLAFQTAAETEPSVSPMPLAECTALSQGYVGYHLQQALDKHLQRAGSSSVCSTIVSQVVVDPDDPAFQDPTKPIGAFVSQQEARRLMQVSPQDVFKEDSGRGWRLHVPSPLPQSILQRQVVELLMQAGHVVVACGGGGIPVVPDDQGYRGVQAVIDKDLSAAKLGDQVGAQDLLILTTVNHVALHYGTAEEEPLRRVTSSQMRGYLDQGHFAEGSMKPKVLAALEFVQGAPGRRALIGSLDQAAQVMAGTSGTVVVSD